MSTKPGTSELAQVSMMPAEVGNWWNAHGLRRIVTSSIRWTRTHGKRLVVTRASRRLNVIETVSLGEKRFVTILCVDGEQFLLGGSSSNVVLLAKLDDYEKTPVEAGVVHPSFDEVISRSSAK